MKALGWRATEAGVDRPSQRSGVSSSEAAITSGEPGAHVCPANVAAFKAHVVDAVNRMTVGVGHDLGGPRQLQRRHGLDPAPTGAWTETSGGNGCHDGSGNPIGTAGELVSVRVEYTYQPITPIISSIFGSVPLSGSATMVIN